MIIRNAKLEDLDDIVCIYNSTIPGRMVTADLEPVTVQARMEWFKEHDADKRPLWVAEENNEILGWVSLSSFYGRPAYDATVEVSIYIKEECRGKGLGKTLMNKVMDFAPTIGVENLLGFIFAHNKPSLALFEKYNFKQWAYLPGVARLDGVYRDLVILGYKV